MMFRSVEKLYPSDFIKLNDETFKVGDIQQQGDGFTMAIIRIRESKPRFYLQIRRSDMIEVTMPIFST